MNSMDERTIPQRPSASGRIFAICPLSTVFRALAVAAVFAYHADVPWARGGFLGVDVSFVASGFLITALLLTEWRRSGRLDVARFWRRRALRLLPALLLPRRRVGRGAEPGLSRAGASEATSGPRWPTSAAGG